MTRLVLMMATRRESGLTWCDSALALLYRREARGTGLSFVAVAAIRAAGVGGRTRPSRARAIGYAIATCCYGDLSPEGVVSRS